MPFWFFQGIRYVPSIPYVQKEIADFVKENTENCINNFKAFEGQFKIEPLDEMDVTAILNERDVSVKMDYPLRIYTKINKNGFPLLWE